MNRVALVVCALACAGCLDIKPFPAADCQAGSGASTCNELVASSQGTGARVSGPLYDVRFADTGFGYPDTISVGGSANLLATGSPQCSDEDQVGVALYPAIRASASAPAPASPVTWTVSLTGPDVAKVSVDWMTTHQCASVSRLAAAHSTFTFFGDGRVVRWDHITDTGNTMPAAGTCSCGPNSSTWLVSSFTTIRWPSVFDGATLPTDTGAGTTSTGLSVCAGLDGVAYAVGTPAGVIRARSPIPTTSLALVYDTEDQPPQTLPASVTEDARTMWYMAREGCPTARPYLETYLSDVQLDLDRDGTSTYTPIGRSNDGIYGGEDAGDAGYPVGDTVHLRATTDDVPAGAAVWLKLSGSRSSFTFTRQSGAEVMATYNQPFSDQIVIYFKDPITNIDPITLSFSP